MGEHRAQPFLVPKFRQQARDTLSLHGKGAALIDECSEVIEPLPVFGASRDRSEGNNREPSGSRTSRQAKGSNSVTMATLPSASSAVMTP